MQKFHPLSFFLGLVSGLVVLVLLVTMHVFTPARSSSAFASGGGQNLSRMAQRFGMTQDALQKEIAAGKTLQQIAQEHGVQFGGRGRGGNNASLPSGSGAAGLSASGSLRIGGGRTGSGSSFSASPKQ